MGKQNTKTTGLDILILVIMVLKKAFEEVLKTKTEQARKWGHEVGAVGSAEELVSNLLTEIFATVLERVEHQKRIERDAEQLQNIIDTEDMLVELEGDEARIKAEKSEKDKTPTTERTHTITEDCSDIEQLIDTNHLLINDTWGHHTDGQDASIDYSDDLDELRMCMEESMDMYLRDNGERPETEDSDTDYKTESDHNSDQEDQRERRRKRRKTTQRKGKGKGKRTKLTPA